MEGKPSPQDLARACHEIVDAAASLMTNLEMLTETPTPGQQDIVEDARKAILRVAKLARLVRAAVEGKKVNLASLAPLGPSSRRSR